MLGYHVSSRPQDERVETSLLASPVAEARGTGVDTGKVVVVVGDGDGLVLGPVAFGVTNNGCQPVLPGG